MNCPHRSPGSPPCTECVRFRDRAVDVALCHVEATALIVAQLGACAHPTALESSTWCVLCGAQRVSEHEWLRPALGEWAKRLEDETPGRDRPLGRPDDDGSLQ